MKHLLLMAMIFLGAQVTQAKPVVTDMPSGHEFVEIIANYTAAEVERIGTMIRNTLPQLPDTNNYTGHSENLRKLLQQTEEFKNSSSCLDKALIFSQQFKEFLVFYLVSDDSVEYAKIVKLLSDKDGLPDMKKENVSVEHARVLKLLMDNGLQDMQADFEAFINLVKSGKFGSPVMTGSPSYTEWLEMKC